MYNQCTPDRTALQTTRNLQCVKEYFAKPLTLICALLKLVEIAAAVTLGIFWSTLDFSSYINYIIKSFSPYADTSGGYVSYNLTSIPSSVVIPGVVVFALVFGYIKSRSKDENSSPKASVIIFRVISILGVVGSAILAVVYALSAAAAMVAIWGYDISRELAAYIPIDASGFAVAITVLLSVLGVGVILLLIMSICQLSFVNSIRRSISSPTLLAKGAVPFAVMTVFSAVSSACTAAFCIILSFSDYSKYMDAPQFASLNFAQLKTVLLVSAIASCLSFAYDIALAALTFGYKRHITSAVADGVYLPEDYSLPAQPVGYDTAKSEGAQQACTNPGELRHAANPAFPAASTPVPPAAQPVQPESAADYEASSEPGIQTLPESEAAPEPNALENHTTVSDNAQPSTVPVAPAPLPVYPVGTPQAEPVPDNELDENVYAPVIMNTPAPPVSAPVINKNPTPVLYENPAPVEPANQAQSAATPATVQQTPTADAAMATPAFCSYCGARLTPGSRFCSSCGNKIN